jgi:hypothetical protein
MNARPTDFSKPAQIAVEVASDMLKNQALSFTVTCY